MTSCSSRLCFLSAAFFFRSTLLARFSTSSRALRFFRSLFFSSLFFSSFLLCASG
ncbi:unnamed protein product [Chondrus crispus]|uniref:Uncharacterized protein n=1 Tax=Chondrus crispus TaxID=2769 RepID=R7Q4A4_CHOCR|nr:unnamed protein product [Chondrus crispus]CDF32703.1 unnamed protein product [Chondrus crispus]|eukprot:XP_005712474.1 unnamed protein product [Chondrus crispus]